MADEQIPILRARFTVLALQPTCPAVLSADVTGFISIGPWGPFDFLYSLLWGRPGDVRSEDG